MPKNTDFAPTNSCLKPSLHTFNPRVQHYGTFFSAFPWQAYCTGTYRTRQSLDAAKESFRKFVRVLCSKLKCPVAYLAVTERITSGLGKPPGPWHWHYLLCGPTHRQTDLLQQASALWNRFNGNTHVLPYCSRLNGARYLAKTAAEADFDFDFGGFERLSMPDPLDLFEGQQNDAYVPDHVRHTLTIPTLVLRARHMTESHLNYLDKCEAENGRNR